MLESGLPKDGQLRRARFTEEQIIGVLRRKSGFTTGSFRWAVKGVWTDIFYVLASAGGPAEQVLIDSSAVKGYRCAFGGKGGNKIRRSADRGVGAQPRSTR
jgi:hypothetical protein